VKRRGYWRGWIGPLRHDSCEFRNLKIHVYPHGGRVIPPWVPFNQLIAVEALKRHGTTPLIALRTCSHSIQPILRDQSGRIDIRHDLRLQGRITEVTDAQFDSGSRRIKYRAPHDASARCVEHLPTDFQWLRRFGVRHTTDGRHWTVTMWGLEPCGRHLEPLRSTEAALYRKRRVPVCRMPTIPTCVALHLERSTERQDTPQIVDGPETHDHAAFLLA